MVLLFYINGLLCIDDIAVIEQQSLIALGLHLCMEIDQLCHLLMSDGLLEGIFLEKSLHD